MPNEPTLRQFSDETVYDLVKVGSFGRFKTGDSFPIEFVMTTFSPAELYERLTFARELESAQLDFALLMQRDIDEDRVRREMEPYLNRSARPSERNDVVFFPPLLAAIVPVENESMLDYYESSSLVRDETYVVHEWPPFFRMQFFTSINPDATIVRDSENSFAVTRDPAELRVRIAKGDEKGTRLVVIDGQHRLLAIRRVYESDKKLLKDLAVPVCIVFPPESTLENVKKSKPVLVQNVPQVFRRLFVDVNETMEKVGGHFTILLSDDTVPALASRQFCDYVLRKQGKEGLAAVEWNIRTRKNSYDLNRPYSLTSIGLLTRSLESMFKQETARLHYVLNLPEVEEELHPTGFDGDEYPRNVKWDNFSISQKPILEKQIEKYLAPALTRVIFSVSEHRTKLTILKEQLGEVQAKRDKSIPGSDAAKNARKVLGNVLDYRPILKADEDALSERSVFFNAVKKGKEKLCAEIIDRALFQRALLDVWARLIDEGRALEVPLENTVDACISLCDHALINKGRNFEFTQEYMQHSVFMNGRIKAKEDTRKALARLIEAHLGNRKVANAVAQALANESGNDLDQISTNFRDIGINAAIAFGMHYRQERTKGFKKSYMVDPSLDKDDRDELAKEERRHKIEKEEYQAGKRKKEDVSTTFSILVERYVAKDVERAMNSLARKLDLDVDILLNDEADLGEDEIE